MAPGAAISCGTNHCRTISRGFRCGCGGICSTECPVCGKNPRNLDWAVVRATDGNEYRVPPAYPGAEGRYEGWIAVFNARLQEGRKRPVTLHG